MENFRKMMIFIYQNILDGIQFQMKLFTINDEIEEIDGTKKGNFIKITG